MVLAPPRGGEYLQDLFSLNKDSVRVYLDKSPHLTKGAKGGFAIGGFEIAGKGLPIQDYLSVTPENTKIYVKEGGKGAKGGFAIGGFTDGKGATADFMNVNKNNYFIGHETGIKVPDTGGGLYNSVIGFQAAKELTTGSYNTILGYKADSSLTSGVNNIIIGATAGFKLTTGNHNTLIGSSAGYSHTVQQYNVMIGTSAGYEVTGSYNTFMGINAGRKIKSGTNNTFLGTNAGAMLEEGDGNTIIGIDAGRSGPWDWNTYHPGNTTSNNTIIGNGAGYNLDVGSGNVYIGYYAGGSEIGTVGTPSNNKLYIANTSLTPLIGGSFSPTPMVGINRMPTTYTLEVGGTIWANGAAIVASSTTWSDARYKTDITPLTDALSDILKIKGVRYNWRQTEFPELNFPKGEQIGIVAQDLEKILPELVLTGPDGYKSVSYEKITPVLVEAIKDQQKIIDDQKKTIDVLSSKQAITDNKLQILEREIEQINALLKK